MTLDEQRRYKTEWAREWYRKNPEAARARSAKWVAANREQHNAHSRRYHAANREKALAAQERWREANKDYESKRGKEYRKAHPEVHRKAALKRRYGMTIAEWEAMFDAQGRRCGCCSSSDPGGAHWHTDHEHTTGLVRGILCRHCNHMLTRFNGEDRLLKGVDYLRKHAPLTEALK